MSTRLTEQRGAPPSRPAWTVGRIVAAVFGALLVLVSVAMLGGGSVLLWMDTSQQVNGYLTTDTRTYTTSGHALATDDATLNAVARLTWARWGPDWTYGYASSALGTARIRVTSANAAKPVFVGIAPAAAAERYLAGVQYTTVTTTGYHQASYVNHSGGAPATPPAKAGIWVAHAAGTGSQTLVWPVRDGQWTVVEMNADGTGPVSVRTDAGFTVPSLPWIAAGLLAGGVVFLLAGLVLIVVPVRKADRDRRGSVAGPAAQVDQAG